ncbi:MAG: FAD-binding oxidoreductase [Pseudomonadota bacterium]
MADAIARLRAVAGPEAVVPESEHPGYLTEWRARWTGHTPLILAPDSTERLSAIMSAAYASDIAMVPQGGNTGLVGGQIPHGEVLLSTRRLTSVRAVSTDDSTMTVEAGVTLADAHSAARAVGLSFPLSIGSQNDCQIGGVLSANAGGIHVIRHGNARDLCLGIEAVLPDGRIWNGLNHLRKNNVGYDLKHLLIGGEGTLGVITAAVLKLVPAPATTELGFVALSSAQGAVELLHHAQSLSGGLVNAFELMSRPTVDLIHRAFPDDAVMLPADAPYYALVELSSGRHGSLRDLLRATISAGQQSGSVTGAMISKCEAHANHVWQMRLRASAAMKTEPVFCLKCDLSVPASRLAEFLDQADVAVRRAAEGARPIAFGHVGDGNVHYDVLGPTDMARNEWTALTDNLQHTLHDIAVALGGSISAEHGIGVAKRDELQERKDPTEMAMMVAIKNALDPKGLMNPSKLLNRS